MPTLSQAADGVATFVRDLSKTLNEKKVNVRVATLDWAKINDYPDYLRTFQLGWGPKSLGRSSKMKKWLISEVDSGQADIVHNNGLWMMPNIYAGNACLKSDCKMMFSPHGAMSAQALAIKSLKKSIFWRLAQGPAANAAACFHATAESEYEDIRRFGIKQPVCILPAGVHVSPMERKNETARKELLYLARVHPIKGVENLLRAWAVVQSKFPDWHLVVAGPGIGGYLLSMQELAFKLQLRRIEFRGALFGERKLQAFRDASLYVLPSYSENFGITVAEALAAGTPAIVTRGAPWGGLEKHGAGWWIDVGVDSLINSLEQALTQPAQRLREMGEAGHKWMEREFSWENIGEQFLQTYQWMRLGGIAPSWVKFD